MASPFWNRTEELAQIRKHLGRGVFGYATGRRRIGKTALLVKACESYDGLYHQAVEGTAQQQILHLVEEVRPRLSIFKDVMPRTWSEFLSLLSREKNLPKLIVFDEFPYWVQGDPTLPSFFQKWIDHELPNLKTLLMVSGSSQSMLYHQLLNQSSPLYGRATFHCHAAPLSYRWFCRALGFKTDSPLSFERFSLVGGVPHYWKLMSRGPLLKQAEDLYFKPSAILAEEPTAWLRDEGVSCALPKALMDLVGRGVTKPGELAARLGTAQGNLSRPLAMLLELGLIQRELPFGESLRTTKRVCYSLQDPALDFYFGSYLTHRTQWHRLTDREKTLLLHEHAAGQWEQFCRQSFPGASRYWEGDLEINLIVPQGKNSCLVAECKWGQLSHQEEDRYLEELRTKFLRTPLSKKFKNINYRIFSQKHLPELVSLNSF